MSTIDIKTAVGSAHDYLISMTDLMGGTLRNLRLEEVEPAPDKDAWLITLGFDVSVKDQLFPELRAVQPTAIPYKREYKLFEVDRTTGEVKSMKIREP